MALNTKKMKELRESKGLSQGQAAKAAKLKWATRWADIESGRRAGITVETLEQIAKALDVSPCDLLK